MYFFDFLKYFTKNVFFKIRIGFIYCEEKNSLNTLYRGVFFIHTSFCVLFLSWT